MFNSTEDALRQGLRANNFEKQRWMSLREIFKDRCKIALDNKNFDLASIFATQAQFCREALEAKEISKYLEAAQTQLEPNGNNCAICGDNDHQAFECHHNPLLRKQKGIF